MNAKARKHRIHVSGVRVAGTIALAVITLLAVGLTGNWPYAPSTGWAAGCVLYVAWAWIALIRADPDDTRRLATREDPTAATTDTLLLLAAIASLGGLWVLLGAVKNASSGEKELLALLGVGSVALSWFLVHTLYTLRYAVLYYAVGKAGATPPIEFNQKQAPRYLDFAYLAFTVGMTFQVSDTNIGDPRIRAVILRHMLVSYLFGAVILAMAVNLVASLAS